MYNVLTHDKNVELNIETYGHEDCKPGHYFGPAVREYYLFHYIHSGKGIFQDSNNTYELGEGQGFLIFPKDLTYYRADLENPWSYSWIGISGLNAAEYFRRSGLTRENPIWTAKRDEFLELCLKNMNLVNGMKISAGPRITGYSYLFLSRLIEIAEEMHPAKHMINRQESYLRSAIHYMEQNYHKKITIEEIARHVGLDRNYLGSLFKKHLNVPMREFLANLRINKACGLLKREDIRIADVARSVGYEDQLQFSKVFKKQKGMCPLDYKKSVLENPHI